MNGKDDGERAGDNGLEKSRRAPSSKKYTAFLRPPGPGQKSQRLSSNGVGKKAAPSTNQWRHEEAGAFSSKE